MGLASHHGGAEPPGRLDLRLVVYVARAPLAATEEDAVAEADDLDGAALALAEPDAFGDPGFDRVTPIANPGSW